MVELTERVRAPRGSHRICKGWIQEAAMRMLMNNLDPEVAEKPSDLIVYGGTGKAARSWQAYREIVSCLQKLRDDETLLIQSGKAVGVIDTFPWAPRVLISNSMLVPRWATWEVFHELEKLGLIMYGQMTAGSWIYIGTQGILQGTYETFAEAGRRHFGGELRSRFILSAGLGGMGGAQPLAATLNGAVFLGVEVDPSRVKKRLETGYLDEATDDLDYALKRVFSAKEKGEARSVGVVGNAAEIYPELLKRGIFPDLVTDQTSAHDPLNGYVPAGLSLHEAEELRVKDPDEYIRRAYESMAVHVEAMTGMMKGGSHVFDYGNNIRAGAKIGGFADAFSFPGFVQAYIRPLFCEGKGPFRWVALSGESSDIYRTDRAMMELFPDDKGLINWLEMAGKKVRFQGLPARICWLGIGAREKAGLRFNELVRSGEIKAPIVIGRDHLDCGSVASPNRETEGMKDGSDAIADWPILNALVNAVCGAGWVSVHHGGGVGIGYSIHAGMVCVADGSDDAHTRLSRVLRADPSTGIIRHFDAGYEKAKESALIKGVKIPSLNY